MASTCIAAASTVQVQARFLGKPTTARPSPASRVVVRAENVPQKVERQGLWLPGVEAPAYLDGSLPGDFGFDPLGLLDPEGRGVGFTDPNWLRYAEIINGRWAMLGAAGCITPEILASAGVIPQTVDQVVWWKSGVIPPLGHYEPGYWIDPYALFFIEVILVQFAELKRLQDYRKPGSQGKQYFLGLEEVLKGSGDPAYPGGPFFNLFNLGRTEDSMKELKLKEIKNARLAMLAVFGYGAQAVMTKVGPFQNLIDHLADPTHNNILANFGKLSQ